MSAADKGNWTHTKQWDHTSVVYLTEELLLVLRNIKDDYEARGETEAFKRLMDNVTSFFCGMFV